MQIKKTCEVYFIPARIAIIKKVGEKTHVGKDVEKLELSYIAKGS